MPRRHERCAACNALVLWDTLTNGVCESCIAQAAGETLLMLLAWLNEREGRDNPPQPAGEPA